MATVNIYSKGDAKLIVAYDSAFCPRIGEVINLDKKPYEVTGVQYEGTTYGRLKTSVYVEKTTKKLQAKKSYYVERKQLDRICRVVREAQAVIEIGSVQAVERLDKALQKLTEEDGALLGLSDD
jgi:hypothetical protein